jgi:preprotein translocase subunit SecG
MANVKVYGGGGGAKTRSAPREGSPLIAGVLVGVVLMVAWIILARMTGNDVGLASWGVGGLMGIAIGKTAKPATRATGVLAALLTAGTLLVSKVAVVVFALQPALRDEFVKDNDAVSLMFLADMRENRSFSPELQRTIDARPDLLADSSFRGAGDELMSEMMSEAEARAKTATKAERERLVRAHYDQTLIQTIGFWVLLLMSFGPLDLLWMGLGISTAFNLGQGVI